MHWFLWLLFGIFVINSLLALLRVGGFDFGQTKPIEWGIKAVTTALIAVGILIYGGIL